MNQFRALAVLALAGGTVLRAFSGEAGVPNGGGLRTSIERAFEENRGQFENDVRLACRAGNYTALVTATGIVVHFADAARGHGAQHLQFSSPEARNPQPFGTLMAPIHYFFASGGTVRHFEAALYAGVRYENVEPGQNLELYCGSTGLEYEWNQRAGRGNPLQPLPWVGANVVMQPRHKLHRAPLAEHLMPFLRADADRPRSAVIGGAGWDSAYAVALDGAANIYLAGETWSVDFPASLRVTGRRSKDVFIVKLNSAADTLIYAAVIGGSGDDAGKSITVDLSGNVVVGGTTDSSDFPVTSGVVNSTYSGARDSFLLALDGTGSRLLYSTYLGGSGEDTLTGVAIDSAGAAYVTGYTASLNFPVTGGATNKLYGGGFYDAFAMKVSPGATAIAYSTLLGGSGTDTARGIAVDNAGCSYITGATDSVNFPVKNALHASTGGGGDAFITKLDAGGAIVYSTYLGGSSLDYGTAVAVDAAGTAFVAGATLSQDFPMGAASLQRTNRGNYDVFVASLNAAGTGLRSSTYLGGSDAEEPAGIGIDVSGSVYVVGYTRSADFLLSEFGKWPYHGGEDAFLVKLRSTLDALLDTECLGGTGDDRATGVALDATGQAFVAGRSTSGDLTTQRIGLGGAGDAFLIRLGGINRKPVNISVTPALTTGFQQTLQVTVADADGAADIAGVMILITPTLGSNKGCLLFYDRPAGVLALADGGFNFPLAGLMGASATLENNQCSVVLSGASALASGTTLTLTVPIALKTGLAGPQLIYMFSQDRSGTYAGWDQRGTWDVPVGNRAPAIVSVLPSGGTKASQSLTFTVSDPDGAADLLGIMILIGPALNDRNGCLLFYDRAAGIVALADEAMTFPWSGAVGANTVMENRQCFVALGGASAVASGANLILTLPVTFKPTVAGRQAIYVFTQDRAGAYAGWEQRGWWDVPPGNRLPATVGVTPPTGTGSTQAFTFMVADPDGADDVFGMMVLITPTLGSSKGCLLFYDRAAGTVALADDTNRFVRSGRLGTATTLDNSQCSIGMSTGSASVMGTRLALTLPVAFKTILRGSQSLYVFTQDRAGAYAGWNLHGTWTVP